MELYVYKLWKEGLDIIKNKKLYLSVLTIVVVMSLGTIRKESDREEDKYLVPLGNIIGIRAKTDGVLILGNEDNESELIGGIKTGDTLLRVDGKNVYSNKDVINILNDKKCSNVDISIDRDGQLINKNINVKKEGDEYRLGLWARDKISGVGTMTYYDPQNKNFGALGHAIKDNDTKQLIKVKEGNIYRAKNIDVIKGNEKEVGQILGEFDTNNSIGDFSVNNKFGINGKLLTYDNDKSYKLLKVGDEKDIKLGPAQILFENKDKKIEEYSIEIKKINSRSEKNGKDMIIEVVDERLLEYTGGIVQGMSGAPIIQNNKIIGAITHVFIDNSKIGYGIFINKMIK